MKSKKTLCIISLFLMMAMLIASCGAEKSEPETTTQVATAAETKEEIKETFEPLLKEKITLKILCQAGATLSNDMPVMQELERLTNVHLEIEILPAKTAERIERFTAAMAAREPFDIITIQDKNQIAKYGAEGVLIPLNDLMKEHAPNMYEKLKDPVGDSMAPYKANVLPEITAPDGNIYNIPLISPANAVGAVWGIRKDWLDKLNLKMPETTDELYNVLKAFKENDTNGNGQQDEVPLGSTGSGTLVYNFLPIINGFGAHITLYRDDADDTIKYGPIESVWKEGMAFLNKLYKEELLDPNWTTATAATYNAQLAGNQLGMMYGWPQSGLGGATKELQKIDPSYRFVPMPPLKAPNGKRYKDTSTSGWIVVPRTAITATNKYPVETIKYLDFMYSEEGDRCIRYGVEGVHYEMINGEPKIKQYLLDDTTGLGAKDGIDAAPLGFVSLWDRQAQYDKNKSNYVKEEDVYYVYMQPGTVEAPLPSLNFIDIEQEKGPTAFKAINSYAYSKWTPFITGEEPLDKYDDYVAQIKTLGIDEVLRIYNQAYGRYRKLAK